MRFKEYLYRLTGPYKMCDKYAMMVMPSNTKIELLDIGLDINGLIFLAKLSTNPDKPDYDVLRKEFGPYANGRYVRRKKYTSCFFLDYGNDVNITTNLTLFMQCDCKVIVRDWDVVSLFVDSDSKISIEMGEHSHVTVYRFGNGEVIYSDKYKDQVRFKNG